MIRPTVSRILSVSSPSGGEREAAQSARAWCVRVADATFTGRAIPGCELSDLPDKIRELALVFYRGRIATAKEEARARRVTPAAIRKRRSRASATRARRSARLP